MPECSNPIQCQMAVRRPRRNIPLSNEEKDKAFKMNFSGLSISAIASEVEVSRTVICKLLKPDYAEYRKKYQTDRNKVYHMTHLRKFGNSVVAKRPKPNSCEVCGRLHDVVENPNSILQWHHWNDEHPELGMWLCFWCHMLAEAIENGLSSDHIIKYVAKKGEINGKLFQPITVSIS